MSRNTGSKPTTISPNLPVLYVPAADLRLAGRYALPASLASQIMASRDRLSRVNRADLSPAHLASNAYAKGGKIAVKRMPNGYVRTMLV